MKKWIYKVNLHKSKHRFVIFCNKFSCSRILECLSLHLIWKMKSQLEYINLLKNSADVLKNHFGITSMRLFGSVAKNTHTEESDVDLFVKMPKSFYNAIAAAQFLEELLGCKVDLICDHKNLSPFFRKQIGNNGIDIFSAA